MSHSSWAQWEFCSHVQFTPPVSLSLTTKGLMALFSTSIKKSFLLSHSARTSPQCVPALEKQILNSLSVSFSFWTNDLNSLISFRIELGVAYVLRRYFIASGQNGISPEFPCEDVRTLGNVVTASPLRKHNRATRDCDSLIWLLFAPLTNRLRNYSTQIWSSSLKLETWSFNFILMLLYFTFPFSRLVRLWAVSCNL